jgi:hypothetical protein
VVATVVAPRPFHPTRECVLCAAGRLCFVFSRLRVVDEESERGKPKLSTLSFEDFLEALVRVATMKALPTYAELALLGARDAGTFLIGLRAKNPTGYSAFVKARERGWEDTLRQPIQRCLEHLLSLLLRTIEYGLPSAVTSELTIRHKELVKFHEHGGAIKAIKQGGARGGVALDSRGLGHSRVASVAAGLTLAEELGEESDAQDGAPGGTSGFSFASLMGVPAPLPRVSLSTRGVGEGMSVVSKGMASKLHGRWGVTARKEAQDPQLQGAE